MTATETLIELQKLGVVLKPQGDNVHYRAPRGVLTPELLQSLVKHKAEVLTLLIEPVDYAACVCSVPVGRTGPDTCIVCELPLICPVCERCRGCKLRLRFPEGGR